MKQKPVQFPEGRKLFATAVRDALSFEIASATDGAVPEWVPMMPGGSWTAFDGRGPFKVTDAAALVQKINASITERGVKHKLDAHHQSRTAKDKKGHVPAYAWLDQYRVGEGGRIEAHVEMWTDRGRKAVESKELRYISPEFFRGADGEIEMIVAGSLTNEPLFDRLQVAEATGGEEAVMDVQKLFEALCAMLGLDPAATKPEAVAEAVKALAEKPAEAVPEAASAATALGLETGVSTAAIFTAAAERAVELTTVKGKLETAEAELAKLQTAEAARVVEAVLTKHAKKIPPAKLDAARIAAAKDPAAFDALYATVADPLTAEATAAPAPDSKREYTLADVPPHLVQVAKAMGKDPVAVYKHAQERGI